MNDFTVVLGVDTKTIESFNLVVPTWREHKPSLFLRPWVVFYDGLTKYDVVNLMISIGKEHTSTVVAWPPNGVVYPRDNLTKWTKSQRAKMLAGFVYMPRYVYTPYWLKLDLDVIAASWDDWVDPDWFDGNLAIIAPSWSYSKPSDCMLKMDAWVKKYPDIIHVDGLFANTTPLNLKPEPGSDKVIHPRICSWCAFFNTAFTRRCLRAAHDSLGLGQIPIDSQDGFHFYCATRAGYPIRTVQMKRRGWKLCPNLKAVKETLHK